MTPELHEWLRKPGPTAAEAVAHELADRLEWMARELRSGAAELRDASIDNHLEEVWGWAGFRGCIPTGMSARYDVLTRAGRHIITFSNKRE